MSNIHPLPAPRLIEEINHYIDTAQAAANRGDYADVIELQPKITQLCQHIDTMPKEVARLHVEQLSHITSRLDTLRDAMLSQREHIQHELMRLDTAKRASHAYAKHNTPTES